MFFVKVITFSFSCDVECPREMNKHLPDLGSFFFFFSFFFKVKVSE